MTYSSLSVGPRVPPELTDLVITFLHDDYAALDQCALTCKSWLNRSRHCRYRKVVILALAIPSLRAHFKLGDVIQFTHLLRNSTSVGQHVESLQIQHPRPYMADNAIGNFDLSVLAELLPLLPKLSKLHLHKVELFGRDVNSLDTFCVQSPITLVLTEVMLQPATFDLFREISSLRIVGSCKIGERKTSQNNSAEKHRVSSFLMASVQSNGSSVRSTVLDRVIKFSEVIHFICDLRSTSDIDETNHLLGLLSHQTLRILDFDLRFCLHYRTRHKWDGLKLTPFTQLQSSRIHIALRYGREIDALVWGSTLRLLSQICASSITNLAVHLYLTPNTREDVVQRMKFLDWGAFNRLLIGIPTLQAVAFHVAFGLYFTVQDPEPYKPFVYEQVREVILARVKKGEWRGHVQVFKQHNHWESLDVS